MNIVPLVSARVQTPPSGNGLPGLQSALYSHTVANGWPVRQLMPWLLDRRNLEAAWERVRSADGAGTPGIDGVTCDSIRDRVSAWLTELADDLFQRRYRPMTPHFVEIPKPNKPGSFRKLAILTIRDRVVHAALKQVLEPVLEPVFLPTSFGFRPGRSVPGALAEAVHLLTGNPQGMPPFQAAVHLDVADCFDTIDHRLLFAEIRRHVGDADMLELIERLVASCGTPVYRYFTRRLRGIPQGSSLSPLLCNLHLHPLDEALAEFGRASGGGIAVLRYADDLLLLGRDQRLAERGVTCVRRVLSRLQQSLRDPHVRPVSLSQGVHWLGVRLRPRPRPWASSAVFGYAIPDDRVLTMLNRLSEMTTPPSERIDGTAFNLSRWVVSINEQLRDWCQAYRFADNASEVFAALDEHCRRCVGDLLVSVYSLRGPQLYDRYRVRLPRGFWTWQVEGVRLVNLSSLAPHAPIRRTRRPVWMTRSNSTDTVTELPTPN